MAGAACDLERDNVAFPNLDLISDAWCDLLDDTAEFVAEDVAFVHLHDDSYNDDQTVSNHFVSFGEPENIITMQEMQVAAANSGAGNLENNIAVFEELGLWNLNWWEGRTLANSMIAGGGVKGGLSRTNFNLLLALPSEGFHGLTAVSLVPLVAGDILLDDVVVVVADDLLDRVGCLY